MSNKQIYIFYSLLLLLLLFFSFSLLLKDYYYYYYYFFILVSFGKLVVLVFEGVGGVEDECVCVCVCVCVVFTIDAFIVSSHLTLYNVFSSTRILGYNAPKVTSKIPFFTPIRQPGGKFVS